MSLIIFLNLVFLNLLLGLPTLKKLHRDYSKFSQHAFLQELSDLTWDSILSAKDPSKVIFTFYNKLNKLLDKHVLLPTLSKCKSKQLEKPWITKGFRKAIKMKMSFFSLAAEKDTNVRLFSYQ